MYILILHDLIHWGEIIIFHSLLFFIKKKKRNNAIRKYKKKKQMEKGKNFKTFRFRTSYITSLYCNNQLLLQLVIELISGKRDASLYIITKSQVNCYCNLFLNKNENLNYLTLNIHKEPLVRILNMRSPTLRVLSLSLNH